MPTGGLCACATVWHEHDKVRPSNVGKEACFASASKLRTGPWCAAAAVGDTRFWCPRGHRHRTHLATFVTDRLMSQVKIYGHRASLQAHRTQLSDAIHSAIVDALSFPPDKRFHRFVALDPEDFIHPVDRSANYTIIEISMFEGRSAEAKRQLISLLFGNIQRQCGIAPQDVEITIFETPKSNWGIRGLPADELALNYKVNV
jgi:phenylpyruvate tautomerase PptA (4-oxalocrotonate tautomerase family)